MAGSPAPRLLRLPWQTVGAAPDPDEYPWELYNLTEDFSQSKDLAKENPKKLRDLQARFLMEAVKYNVLPLDSSFVDRMESVEASQSPPRPDGFHVLSRHDSHPGSEFPGHEQQVVPHHRRCGDPGKAEPKACWRRRADGSAAGVLLVLDGKPMFAYAYTNQDGAKYPKQRKDKTRIAGRRRLAPGKHTIVLDFAYDGGGIGKGGLGTLTVDGKKVAEGRIEQTTPIGKFSLDESFDVGEDTGSPVIDEYDAKMPFKFTGTLREGRDQARA